MWTDPILRNTYGNNFGYERERSFYANYFQLWDRIFNIPYCEGRQELRKNSLECFSQVRKVDEIIFSEKGKLIPLQGVVLATDDDDFYAPWIFEETEKFLDGKYEFYYWNAYRCGPTENSLVNFGKLKMDTYPHTNNIVYDFRKGYISETKKPIRYKGADSIEKSLSFWNANPWSISAPLRLATNKEVFWSYFTLEQKMIYFLCSYIKKSEASLKEIPDNVWFKPWWRTTIELTRLTLGDKIDYQFPIKPQTPHA